MTDAKNLALGKTEAPESFPPELLAHPVGARQEYFEHRCLISHPRLQEALETILQAICPPGEGASTRRPGTMVLVIGPSRVGKTTLIRLLEERLLASWKAHLLSDSSFLPFASVLAAGGGTNRFEWVEYYRAVLRALHDPFVDGKVARIRARELREAMETALLERKPLTVCSLHAQGIYPSLHKVQSFLPTGVMLQPEARETWHAVLRELGVEPRNPRKTQVGSAQNSG